jgi:hypothetical protein
MERAADLPEQVEQGQQLLALPLQRFDPGGEAGDLLGGADGRGSRHKGWNLGCR